jgi:benzylsuccinate CoA-transferase BbsE subunit
MQQMIEGILSPYRVLDLTDEKGLLCSKLFGDLGADVIKIEKPVGDPARNIGPFYHDDPEPEKSLFWWAFNTNKRGITLDIEKADGQWLFKRLVKTADFVIESFSPGYMDKLGLDYSSLEKINPGIIMISITPFGQTGPYKDYKAPDIVAWAMGGQLYACGDEDRPPIQISHHSQAYLNGAAEAAAGAMLALFQRQATGQGQYIDVSIQEHLAQNTFINTSGWDMVKANKQRQQKPGYLNINRKSMWPCRDGYVMWTFFFSQEGKRRSPPLVDWMDSEGMADDFIKTFDWENSNILTVTQDTVDRLEAPTAKFFLSHTKDELYKGAIKHRVMLFAVFSAKDILSDVQLADRKFWKELEHPELGTKILYPGPFARITETPPVIQRRPPLIGEHNEEVYERELGLHSEEIITLKQAGVI